MAIKHWGTKSLRNGQPFDIQLVTGREESLAEEITGFLGHKGYPWVWHAGECLLGRTPGMEARWYVARLRDRPIGNVTVFKNGHLGNLSHVFTAEDMRRQGISRSLIDAAVSDFSAEGGKVMVLGTGFASMPWRFYQSFGFAGICPEQGYGGMVKFFGDASWENISVGPPEKISDADWRHYVGTQLLFGEPGPQQVRSILLPSIGPRLMEEQYIRLAHRWQQGEPIKAWVIEGKGPSVLGCAVVGPHPLWGSLGRHRVLDFFFHPVSGNMARDLLDAALSKTPGPVECYCDTASQPRIKLLRERGFKEHRLPSALAWAESQLDIIIMTGEGG